MPDDTPPTPRPVTIDRALLAERWPLPDGATSKHQKGDVVVIGGARKTPGAVILAGIAALRVGAGRITLCVGESVADAVAVAVPESGVVALPETKTGSVDGRGLDRLAGELASADVALVGPGLVEPADTERMLRRLVPLLADVPAVHLDAFPLGVLAGERRVRRALAGRLLLTPNAAEAERLLGEGVEDLPEAVLAIARRYDAVVSCFNTIATPEGEVFALPDGDHRGLATAGSGDVLAGATAGLHARGIAAAGAAAWGVHLHTAADDRLAARIGPLGYLAGEIPGEFPGLMAR